MHPSETHCFSTTTPKRYRAPTPGTTLKEGGPLEQVLEFSVGGLKPDLTVLLDIDPDTAARRRPHAADRFEQLGTPFTRRVRLGYLTLAADDADCWVVIDAAGTETAVAVAVAAAVKDRLGLG